MPESKSEESISREVTVSLAQGRGSREFKLYIQLQDIRQSAQISNRSYKRWVFVRIAADHPAQVLFLVIEG